MKKYDELTITDDFMFCKILESNENLCKELVELILDEKVEIITRLEKQKPIEITSDGRGIRLDVSLLADKRIISIEMQNGRKGEMPKRSRYYQGMIDVDATERGTKYTELKDSFIIFICTFDPFDLGFMKYTVKPYIVESQETEYNDGTTKIFLSASIGDEYKTDSKPKESEIRDELKEFLKYIAGKENSSELAVRFEKAVAVAKSQKKWRKDYMLIDEMRDEARDEGVEIGDKNRQIKVAKQMIINGEPLEKIIQYTELSKEEVEQL